MLIEVNKLQTVQTVHNWRRITLTSTKGLTQLNMSLYGTIQFSLGGVIDVEN